MVSLKEAENLMGPRQAPVPRIKLEQEQVVSLLPDSSHKIAT